MVAALSEANGQPSLPVTIAVGQAEDFTDSWYTLSFGSASPEPPSSTSLELLAYDRQALYLVTASGPAAPNHPGRRSVWIVPKAFFSGASPAIARIDR